MSKIDSLGPFSFILSQILGWSEEGRKKDVLAMSNRRYKPVYRGLTLTNE